MNWVARIRTLDARGALPQLTVMSCAGPDKAHVSVISDIQELLPATDAQLLARGPSRMNTRPKELLVPGQLVLPPPCSAIASSTGICSGLQPAITHDSGHLFHIRLIIS